MLLMFQYVVSVSMYSKLLDAISWHAKNVQFECVVLLDNTNTLL